MPPTDFDSRPISHTNADSDSDDDDSFEEDHVYLTEPRLSTSPNDLSSVPQELLAYPGDSFDQSTILTDIIQTPIPTGDFSKDLFNKARLTSLRLSRLKRAYEYDDKNAVNLLASRHQLLIDDDMRIELGNGNVIINTDESMIDYKLTVANSIGFSSLLSNAASDHRFELALDLHKPYLAFKGKYAMLGFDPAGSMLFIGHCNNEDVFLAMAPNNFLRGRSPPSPPGLSSASPLMSRRHYRQIIMLFAHFLTQIDNGAYYNIGTVYDQNLDSSKPKFGNVTNIMSFKVIRLNFEQLTKLDTLFQDGYRNWVNEAPDHWKVDDFLRNHSPIVVTSRFGQNARIAIPGNESQEAKAWQKERDYSKLAFFTFAIATSIQYTKVEEWEEISPTTIVDQNPDGIFDSHEFDVRHRLQDLHGHPLLDENNHEIPIYNNKGQRISRRLPLIDPNASPCGVLVNLKNIQALFDPNLSSNPDHDHDDVSSLSSDSSLLPLPRVQVQAYPLAFLKSIGNVQADGIPPCFYPFIRQINDSVGKNNPRRHSPSHSLHDDLSTDDEDIISFESDSDAHRSRHVPSSKAVKPVSAQLYNYVAHRVATHAGDHDAQQGTVTAAIAGAFANSQKDKTTASIKQDYCDISLPADRFHRKISLEKSPSCCRAEIVYSVDVRALKNPSGRSIFENIILPLVKSWKSNDIRDVIKNYLIVLEPRIFPALFNWVAYPVTLLISSLYESEMESIRKGRLPCPFRLELLAALERTLCFCHTGSTTALATSLMHPLGLSRGLMKDGFPMLHSHIFKHSAIASAMKHGFTMDMRVWPIKDGYPAIASKKAQILTYSLEHFMCYQATLRIDYALNIASPFYDPSIDSDEDAKAFSISKIAFDAFFQDTRLLVARGVRADIAHKKATASSEQLSQVSDRAIFRESSLLSWLKFERPLAYGNKDVDDVFKLLVQAVCPDNDAVSYGLPNWDVFATNRTDFAISLYNMSNPNAPSSPRAPVLRKGTFLPVLRVAHRSLVSLFDRLDGEARKNAILRVFKKSLRLFEINYFPAPKLNSGTSGAPNTKPRFDSWGHLGNIDTFNPSLDHPSVRSSTHTVESITIAYNNATINDCNADWEVNELNPNTLHSVLNRTSLPKDFYHLPRGSADVIDETYIWVRKYYNGAKPLHHLAIIVAVIATSTLLPNLFAPAINKSDFRNASKEKVRELYEKVNWIDKDKKKGQKEKKIFIAMFTTFIIAIYEDDSPLRRSMAANPKTGLNAWRDKHAVKGVSYVTLIRLGVVWGIGTGATERGVFGRTWGCHSLLEIQDLYKSLCEKLSDKPYGPFDALSHLIGDQNARIFSKRKGITLRPII